MMAFTVGPLGFYECVRMPFGVDECTSNVSAINGELSRRTSFNWCIIYLDDIIIHSRTPEEHVSG